MKKTLGIDFGSTYTIMSCYDKEKEHVEAVQTLSGSKYIPSIACLDDDDNLLFGQEAKDELAQTPELTPFRAFKMLLPETDADKLASHGYSGQHLPKFIAEEFLKRCVAIAKKKYDTKRFDKVVICIPENWNKSLNSLSGKAVLHKICTDMNFADKIQIVTEPAAASAYFAYSYFLRHKTPYVGKILVVDYGGGTLDITLTEVTPITRADGTSSMQIEIRDRTGVGENHACQRSTGKYPRQIGCAGLAYLDSVVRMALETIGYANTPVDGSFMSVLNKLESHLIGHADELADHVNMKYPFTLDDNSMADDTEPFVVCKYRGKKVAITYSMLFNAYKNTIWKVLNEQLDEISKGFGTHGFNPTEEWKASKIAVVGGFGQFILVQKQVESYFGFFGSDFDITADCDTGKEDAVSFGAALLASEEITMRKIAPLTFGLRKFIGGDETWDIAIKCGDKVDYDEPCPVGGKPQPLLIGNPTDPNESNMVFAVNNCPDEHRAYRMIPLPQKRLELQQGIQPGLYYFAFSINESEIYSLHIIPYDPIRKCAIKERAVKYPLGNFSDLFGSTVGFREEDIIYR